MSRTDIISMPDDFLLYHKSIILSREKIKIFVYLQKIIIVNFEFHQFCASFHFFYMNQFFLVIDKIS